MVRRHFVWASLVAALAALGVALVLLFLIPSNHYLFLPDDAKLVDPLVSLPDEDTSTEESGFYMVDVVIRRASLLERIFPRIASGSTLVTEERFNPRGVSRKQRRQSSLSEMSRSQQIAVAVALRELGYEVATDSFGAEVIFIRADSSASDRLQPGDVIVEVEGNEISLLSDLSDVMEDVTPGDSVLVVVRRDEDLLEFTFRTTEAEELGGGTRAVIGIEIQQAAQIDLPLDVSIDAGNIGGPSAGLAFALNIVDELGNDLDAGRRIAVTGEIDLDGKVGAIGGVKQKTIGAENSGADIFIVPAENADEARRHGDDLEIVAVSTFDEALSALTTG